jgi:hypothetical protein
MGFLDQMFPRRRPRRRVLALGGGFSIVAIAGLWIMRTFAGKAEGNPCESARDCKNSLICAETTEEPQEGEGAKRKKKRQIGTGVKLCAKPCASEAACGTGQSCDVVYSHNLGPRGGKLKDKAKGCVADE